MDFQLGKFARQFPILMGSLSNWCVTMNFVLHPPIFFDTELPPLAERGGVDDGRNMRSLELLNDIME